MLVRHAGFDLRDQSRNNENAVPLQFVYEAADRRIFYMKKTYNNFTLLWKYAVEAVWSDLSKCVKDSTCYAKYTLRMERQAWPRLVGYITYWLLISGATSVKLET